MSDRQNHSIDETIDKYVFVGIIETYVPLTRDKTIFRGYCPLCHNDAHSHQGFEVNPDELEWVCEGCGERGGISHFFEQLRNIPRDEAERFARMLASDQTFHSPIAVGLAEREGFKDMLASVSKADAPAATTSVAANTGETVRAHSRITADFT